MVVEQINPDSYKRIVFFTGAGMSAESGVPTYRGKGGILDKYNWQEVASQEAWEKHPKKVLKFHEKRRTEGLKCKPHSGHKVIADLEKFHPNVWIVTQNIDGMHQQAGSKKVVELHGSVWRVRCPKEGRVWEDSKKTKYSRQKCKCGSWLRPDIVWFSDYLDTKVTDKADEVISRADLFISIGTSGLVWPAAGYPARAKSAGAFLVEINPGPSEQSNYYDKVYPGKAGEVMPQLFGVK